MTNAGTDLVPMPTAAPSSAAGQADRPSGAVLCALHGLASPPRPKRCIFAGHPEQVACARRFIAWALAGCPARDDAVLLTSELVTNALQHTATGAGGGFEVIACHHPRRVRITVTDDGSPDSPALAPRATLATSGQGLVLVEALADRWAHHGDERARTVWFELDCR